MTKDCCQACPESTFWFGHSCSVILGKTQSVRDNTYVIDKVIRDKRDYKVIREKRVIRDKGYKGKIYANEAHSQSLAHICTISISCYYHQIYFKKMDTNN